MNLDNLNKWLTLTANVGVLIGIIFLAFELQQNTNISRSSAYRETVQEINDWRALLASDSELTEIFSSYLQGNYNELNRNESSRLRQLLETVLGIYESAYFSYQLGIIGQSEWVRFERMACNHVLRMNEIGMSGYSRMLTIEFNSYLTETCNQP